MTNTLVHVISIVQAILHFCLTAALKEAPILDGIKTANCIFSYRTYLGFIYLRCPFKINHTHEDENMLGKTKF